MTSRQNDKPVSGSHIGAMLVVGVIGALVAFWLLSSIVGIVVFFVKIAVVIALIVGAFWLVGRLRK